MPELPEVTALAAFLSRHTAGRSVEHADVLAFPALKTSDPPVTALSGRPVTGAGRRGKFVVLGCGGLDLVFHLARAGWLTWHAQVPATRVHRRPGERCPVCGDVIREVSQAESAFQYCPACQTGGKLLPGLRTSKPQG